MKLNYSKEWYEKRIASEGDSDIGAGMFRQLPEKIVRLDDGMLFLLNKETNKYRVHLGIPHLDDPKHLHNEYSYDDLMGFSMNNPQKFKVVDGTEDIETMVKNWKKKCESHNDGHGNGEDD